MDRICLLGMEFYAYHGVMEEERRLGQSFVVDCVLSLDLSRAAVSDDLAETVDYAAVYETIRRVAEGGPFSLIERLASAINAEILSRFPTILSAETTVHKPGAPIPGVFRDVSVTVTAQR